MNEREELAWVSDVFDGMMAADDPGARRDYVLRHPVLFSAGALQILLDERGGDDEATEAIALLDEARAHLWRQPEEYFFGFGPLEHVVAALRDGELDFDEALARATAPECAGQLSHTYVRALLSEWLGEVEGDVGFAMSAGDLAWEAAKAMPLPRLAPDVRRGAAEGYIRLVHAGLMRRPDGRATRRAIEAGEWGIADARALDRPELAGAYMHWLGTMLLDAYGANFGPSPEYADQIELWLQRAIEPMPEATVGLDDARQYLESAVDLRGAGSDRGRTLKALLETEVYLAHARRERPDAQLISSLAERAMAALDPAPDRPHVERLRDLVEQFGAS